MAYFCGVDIGGTFTDCVIADAEGSLIQAKVSTTPDDYARGLLSAVGECAQHLGTSREELLAETSLFLHGTTIGTNIMVQMRGAKTGLITTRGHGDALPIMRSAGRSAGLPIEQLLHVSRHRKPEPIVPRHLIQEVTERVDWEGDIVVPLQEDEARAAIRELLDQRVQSIAICLLWGFVNPRHERRIRDLIRELDSDVYVTCAHELIRKPGEYERATGAAINGYIGPATSSYINRLSNAMRESGYVNPLLIMQAAGGVMALEEAGRSPLFTIGSGPVGGLSGVVAMATRLGHRDVIATDMGGTSFEVGIVHDGAPFMKSETIMNQYTFFMPRLDIESIGAGGGSIVRLDEDSMTIRVGPESAQAVPGPVCYGRGGTRPTVTDANVVLGVFGDDAVLSDDLRLDRQGAENALAEVADKLGFRSVEAAAGVRTIVESQMAGLMRRMTVERGLDTRDFVIYAYGGAAGQHATGYARELGVDTVVVPLGELASSWSALGIAGADIVHTYEQTELMSQPFDPERLTSVFERLEEEARRQFQADGIGGDRLTLTRSVDMKFSLQIHELEVEVPGGGLDDESVKELTERFVRLYEASFGAGSAFVDAGLQIGGMRVRGHGDMKFPAFQLQPSAEGGPVVKELREVYWNADVGVAEVPVYDGGTIGSDPIEGPALVEYSTSLVVLHPGDRAIRDELGNLVVTVGGDR